VMGAGLWWGVGGSSPTVPTAVSASTPSAVRAAAEDALVKTEGAAVMSRGPDTHERTAEQDIDAQDSVTCPHRALTRCCNCGSSHLWL